MLTLAFLGGSIGLGHALIFLKVLRVLIPGCIFVGADAPIPYLNRLGITSILVEFSYLFRDGVLFWYASPQETTQSLYYLTGADIWRALLLVDFWEVLKLSCIVRAVEKEAGSDLWDAKSMSFLFAALGV